MCTCNHKLFMYACIHVCIQYVCLYVLYEMYVIVRQWHFAVYGLYTLETRGCEAKICTPPLGV